MHALIQDWYQCENEKIQLQSKINEFHENEKTSLYHHELHKKIIKRTAILQLKTDQGIIEGHKMCSKFLENTVEDLLMNSANLDSAAQASLLQEVDQVFSDEDNEKFLTPTSKSIVKSVLDNCNLLAAPGLDGIPSFYLKNTGIF